MVLELANHVKLRVLCGLLSMPSQCYFSEKKKLENGRHVDACPAPLRIYNSNSKANHCRGSPQHSAPSIITNDERRS